MEYEKADDGLQKSKYNSGQFNNIRLHNLWLDCHKHARQGNLIKWNADLDRVWCELASDEKEKGESDEKFEDFESKLDKLGVLWNGSNDEGYGVKIKEDILKIRRNQYKLLTKKEIWIRRLQNKQGKGTAYDENEGWND